MIQTTEVSITYKGDGVQTSFPYPYPYRNSDDIVGYIINDVGYEKRITNNFKYDKVSNIYQYPLAGEPLAAPYSIKLIRETPQQQNADLPGKLPFSLIEKSLDWIIMILQEIGSRCNSLWHIRNDCKLSETNARNSASAAAESEEKAANSEDMAKKWVMSPVSPDGVVDTNSPTGYTQSAKIWAALAKEYAGLSKFKLPIGYYNSVDEMRASETAIVGRPCVTLGYYEPNDGGGAIYVVRSKAASDTDDGGSILVLDNGNVAELLIDGPINVKQFGAKGDGVHDDTDSIQRAINHVTDTTFEKLYSNGKFIYTKGGGTVYIPSGIYRITETIVIGQYCRIIGDSSIGLELVRATKENFTGSVLVADFTNTNSWILESAIYKKDGTKLGYKEKVNGNDEYIGKINFMRGIYIKNIALYTQNVVYGGIRLCMSPESILENVSISGTLIAILLNATWGSHIINCYTKSYVYGVLSVLDVNSCSISGYFNRIIDDKNIVINDDNRFDLQTEGTGFGWQESMDYKRAGIYSWYSYSLNLQNVITEHWDVGRLLINTYFSDNDGWVEGHSYAAIAARASRGRISNVHITRTDALDYVWGDYTNIILDNSEGDELDNSNGYKMVGENTYHTGITHLYSIGGGHRYLGESDNIIYIKDKTVKGALTYATLNDALPRISTSKNPNWTIYLEAGKTYDFSNSVNITNKNITFVKTGVGDNPRIKHHVNSDRYLMGYQVRNGSTFSLNLSHIDIEIAEDDTPINTSDTGLITLNPGAINGSLMISNANINMKSWCFLQLMTGVSCVLTSSFNNCTYKGTAKRGGYVYNSPAKLIVIDGDYNNTFDDAVIAGTTKGWNDSIATIL